MDKIIDSTSEIKELMIGSFARELRGLANKSDQTGKLNEFLKVDLKKVLDKMIVEAK